MDLEGGLRGPNAVSLRSDKENGGMDAKMETKNRIGIILVLYGGNIGIMEKWKLGFMVLFGFEVGLDTRGNPYLSSHSQLSPKEFGVGVLR